MPGITLSELLKKMIEMGGSDLHITTNSAPRVRVHGRLRPLDMPPLTAADTKYKFRYVGLVSLIHNTDRYLLLSEEWQRNRDPVYVIPAGDDVRIDVIAR